jgi:uncharacterized protein YbaR (Trm112 family)
MSATPKFVVCPECEGEGYVGTLGAYTSDEFEQAFDSYESYSELHEVSKVACPCCKARRVVTSEELAKREEEMAYEAEVRAEQRMMGYY